MSRSLCLSVSLALSLSLSFSLSSIVLCSLVEPNTCVRLPRVYLGSSQVDRRMLDPESAMLQRLGPDPAIRLQKSRSPTPVHIKTHHGRAPDVGIGILISMPSHRAGEPSSEMIEY